MSCRYHPAFTVGYVSVVAVQVGQASRQETLVQMSQYTRQ
jgi:hypothetical protein